MRDTLTLKYTYVLETLKWMTRRTPRIYRFYSKRQRQIHIGKEFGCSYIGATNADLCPVTAVVSFMVERGNDTGPLFIRQDGKYMTQDFFVSEIRKALLMAGLRAEDYAGHSFHIGAATTVAQQGFQGSLIKTLGRWQSSAYTLYIRTPQETLTKVAKLLLHSK